MEYNIVKDNNAVQRIRNNNHGKDVLYEIKLLTKNKSIIDEIKSIAVKYGATLMITRDPVYATYILVFSVSPLISKQIIKLLNAGKYKNMCKVADKSLQPLISASIMNRMDINRFILLPNMINPLIEMVKK